MEQASDLLAKTTKKMTKLVNHLKEKYPKRSNVKRLVKNYNPRTIKETLPTSEYTAYSENKGEKIAFCLNTKKNNNTLIDLNTLTYVAIHEMGHVASETIGHNDEFWNNFKFLLEEAVLINIYKPVDYKNESVTYCGMELTDNPYYDM
jgi:predicted metal-dependent hydrolase